MADYVKNKTALLSYEVVETYTAGIQLLGLEVKSIKTGKAQITGSYITIKNDEAFLLGSHIAPYQPENTPASYSPARERKLLLNKKEIRQISQIIAQKKLTIIPLKLYNRNNKIKAEIAIVKGKQKGDKRQKIRKKDTRKEIGHHI